MRKNQRLQLDLQQARKRNERRLAKDEDAARAVALRGLAYISMSKSEVETLAYIREVTIKRPNWPPQRKGRWCRFGHTNCERRVFEDCKEGPFGEVIYQDDPTYYKVPDLHWTKHPGPAMPAHCVRFVVVCKSLYLMEDGNAWLMTWMVTAKLRGRGPNTVK